MKAVMVVKCEKIFEVIDSLNDEYIGLWADACSIESPTDFKEGVDKCGEIFIKKAKALGFDIDIYKEEVSGNAVCITMNNDSALPPVIFSGHLDTVHPIGSFGNPPVSLDDEYIYGPGANDCKGGIVAALLAMDALSKYGFKDRPIKLLLQSDEENGSRFCDKRTVQYMCEKSKGAAAFLNCEGYGPHHVVIERKGILKYSFEVTGRAAHASVCYNGVSAIAEAARKISELEKLKNPDGLTCNCGLISGGTAENSVPEKCTFTADIRFKTVDEMEEAKRLVEKIASTAFIEGSTCKATLVSYRTPMEKRERNYALLDKVNEIFKENNIPTVCTFFGNGGSDAADLSQFGVPTIDGLGTEGKFIHSINERGLLSSLARAAKRLAAIAYCI